ncbi:MAG: hypothetical protein RIE52_06310 [Balneola sp.]|jgi:hypothetical protein
MDINFFIDKVGKKEFKATALRAVYKAKNWRKESKKVDLDNPDLQADYDLITDIIQSIFEAKSNHNNSIKLLFDFYKVCPSFTVIDDIYVNYWRELFNFEKEEFWENIIEILNSKKDYPKEPIIYALWCDFFEDPRTVNQSWNALVTNETTDEVLKIVLVNSGPVPFNLKKELYYRLLGSDYWHKYIFKSLLHSQFDVYGDIDTQESLKILGKLNISKETEHLDLLMEKLNSE